MQLFAGRFGDDFDAGFERVLLVEQGEVGLAFFAEELFEHLAEVDFDLREGLGEEAFGLGVDAVDDFEQLGFRGNEVVVLVLEEVVAFLEFLELFDGVEVDGAHGVEAALDVVDDGLDEVPVGLAGYLAGDFDVVVGGAIDDHGRHFVFVGIVRAFGIVG